MLGLSKGYTLLELIVTMAIVAIIATVAAPPFVNTIASQKIRSSSDTLVSTLLLARSEAVTRNTSVVVQSNGGSWQSGWSVSVGGTAILQEEGIDDIVITASSGSITFNPSGRASASATFLILPDSGKTTGQRCVSLTLSGKPRNNAGGC